jgi:hypothetical protein
MPVANRAQLLGVLWVKGLRSSPRLVLLFCLQPPLRPCCPAVVLRRGGFHWRYRRSVWLFLFLQLINLHCPLLPLSHCLSVLLPRVWGSSKPRPLWWGLSFNHPL